MPFELIEAVLEDPAGPTITLTSCLNASVSRGGAYRSAKNGRGGQAGAVGITSWVRLESDRDQGRRASESRSPTLQRRPELSNISVRKCTPSCRRTTSRTMMLCSGSDIRKNSFSGPLPLRGTIRTGTSGSECRRQGSWWRSSVGY
jgi:hypothetical protein